MGDFVRGGLFWKASGGLGSVLESEPIEAMKHKEEIYGGVGIENEVMFSYKTKLERHAMEGMEMTRNIEKHDAFSLRIEASTVYKPDLIFSNLI